MRVEMEIAIEIPDEIIEGRVRTTNVSAPAKQAARDFVNATVKALEAFEDVTYSVEIKQ